MKIFEKILDEMDRAGADHTPPKSFADYLDEVGVARKRDSARTAACISVDFQEDLKAELKERSAMVFRLGRPPGQKNTFFAIARVKESWKDYFLFDNDSATYEEFEPERHVKEALTVFRLLPRLTEKSLVSFTFASGLIQNLLGLDSDSKHMPFANCQSTFTFNFSPHKVINTGWTHSRGQVEIDGLFFANKGGRKNLFLVESKHQVDQKTLAKHKLVYPILSMQSSLEKHDIPITPMYLKTKIVKSDLFLTITVCDFPLRSCYISELEIRSETNVVIRNFLH